MADLKIIDDITSEICKIRGVDLPYICIKVIVLSYIAYACNTFNIKYVNEDGFKKRPNVGCIILCQKGTGKSRTIHALKQIFKIIEEERKRRYETIKNLRIGILENSMIPLTEKQKKEVENFYTEYGAEVISIFDDPITSKALCATYAQIKKYNVHNLLFMVDEAGDRIFKDALGRDPSLAAKEFLNCLNQLFDGYCGMGQSRAAQQEKITSQSDVGATYIFVSTAEFLNDYHVQKKYESVFEGGLARRCLYINCPPIDKLNTDRTRYFPKFEQFIPIVQKIFTPELNGKEIGVSEQLWQNRLEKKGACGNLTIDEEYLLLLFCTVLTAWTEENEIKEYHWDYMVDTYHQMQKIAIPVVQKNTNNYEKICIFIREYLEKNSTKKKVPIALVKDYCIQNKMCFDSQFKKWFKNLIDDFVKVNISKYIIEKNQTHVWLSENFAYEGK